MRINMLQIAGYADALFKMSAAFILGVGAASFGMMGKPVAALALLCGLLILVLDHRSFGAVFLIGLGLGAGYLNIHLEDRLFREDRWQPGTMILRGTVIDGPDVHPTGVRLVLKIDGVVLAHTEGLKGKIGVFGCHRMAEIRPGHRLLVSGPVSVDQDETFRSWRLKEGIYASMFHPRVEKIGFNWLYAGHNLLFRVRQGGIRLAESNLPEPQSSLLKAMLLGRRPDSRLSFSEELRRTGLSHIAVVSGMHLVLLAQLSFSMARLLKRNPFSSALIALATILLFVVVTGGRPSVYRAGLMSGFGLVGILLGRLYRPGRALLWAAFFILLANPLLLRWDIGFQLSFAASLGLIYLSPWIRPASTKFFGKLTGEILSVTLAAQLMTGPLAAYHFGQISLIGPLANVLIVAFLPFIFLLGLAFFLSGGFGPVALFLNLGLSAVTTTISFLAGWEWAAVPLAVSPVFLLGYGFFWISVLFFLARKRDPAFHALGLC